MSSDLPKRRPQKRSYSNVTNSSSVPKKPKNTQISSWIEGRSKMKGEIFRQKEIRRSSPSSKLDVLTLMDQRGEKIKQLFRLKRTSNEDQTLSSMVRVPPAENIEQYMHSPYPLPSNGYEKVKKFSKLAGKLCRINGVNCELSPGISYFPDQLEMNIGYGSYGVVYKSKKPNGEDVAVKFSILNESTTLISNLQAAANPYVATPFLVMAMPGTTETISLMPLLDCDLFHLNVSFSLMTQMFSQMEMKVRLSHKQILQLAGQMASALNLVHSVNYFHADVKPENILLKNVQIRKTSDGKELVHLHAMLTDFNISLPLSKDDKPEIITRIQSPAYSAPEVIFETPCNSNADCWSLGLVLIQTMFPGSFELPDYSGPKQAAKLLLEINNEIEEVPLKFFPNGKKSVRDHYHKMLIEMKRVSRITSLQKRFQKVCNPAEKKLHIIIESCLQVNRVERITIPELFESLGKYADDSDDHGSNRL